LLTNKLVPSNKLLSNNKLTYVVGENIEQVKLRDYLKYTENLSSRFLKSSGLNGKIRVNNIVAKLNHRINTKDKIEIDMKSNEHQNIEPEKMDLDVVFEDIDLIVINKSPGLVVHPTKGYPYGTLSNGVSYYFKERKMHC
jgi:23S rRNA pseudouridine1911/1915/1917 synthase